MYNFGFQEILIFKIFNSVVKYEQKPKADLRLTNQIL